MTSYRLKWVAANPQPWTCDECGEAITSLEDLHVHHHDGDRSNDSLDNLRSLHGGCHMRRHMTGALCRGGGRPGVPKSPEHRARIAEAQRRAWARDDTSDGRRAKVIAANKKRRGIVQDEKGA